MDKLLQKLRQNMAELSLQGDDFTRQIWQMYATFEEFIDHQQSPGDGSSPQHPTQEAPPPPPAPSGGLGTIAVSPTRDVTSPYSRINSTMSTVTAPNPSTRFRQKSPSTTSDDLALASPRRSRRRRPRRLRRSVDNPLLDTISTIGGDSDEDSPHHHLYHSHSHNLHLQPHSPANCPRLHLETDIIGYAGSNSVDSGYKSACPTPDLPDLIYSEHRLEKRGSLASLASSGSSGGSNTGSKPRIPMGTRVMSRGGGVPRSPGAGGVITPTKRTGSDSSHYESDQLIALRNALLGSPTEGENRSFSGTRYSPRISPATTFPLSFCTSQRDYHVSRRAASPASPERRPRSASTGSRCSPGARGTRKTLQSGSPHLASTGSLPRATSPGRRPSLSPAGREDTCSLPLWSRHSSPGMSTSAGRGRRPPSPIVGVDQDHELALLEREIDVLLYGGRGAQYYDIESGREYPCPFSTTQETTHSCRPALASVKRLREELQETTISLLVNEVPSHSVSEAKTAAPRERLIKAMSATTIGTTGALVTTTTTTTTTIMATNTSTTSQKSSDNASISSVTGFSSGNKIKHCHFNVFKSAMNSLENSSKLTSGVKTGDNERSFQNPKYRTTPYPQEALSYLSSETCSECSFCSDYHLYEEIIYYSSSKTPTNNLRPPSPPPSPPPPLPKRPLLIQKSAMEFRRGESGAPEKCPVIGKAVKETLVCPSLKYCKCPSEIVTRKQLKCFSRTFVKSKRNDVMPFPQENQPIKNSNSISSSVYESSEPPVPPIRTTSQISQCQQLTCSKSSVPLTCPHLSSNTISSANGTATSRPHPTRSFQPLRLSSNLNDISSSQDKDPSPKDMKVPHKVLSSSDNNLSSPTSIVTQPSKPKQRHNLYSIFKDKNHRRFLSASLELEYHHQPESTKDNKEFKSVSYLSVQQDGFSSTELLERNDKKINEISKPSNSISSNAPHISSELLKETANKNYPSIVKSQNSSMFCDDSLLPVKRAAPNWTGGCHKAASCSLDLTQHSKADDEYGFQALSNVF